MKREIGMILIETASEYSSGNFEFQLRLDYSGRGMSGKATVGIVFDEYRNLLGVVAEAARNLGASEEADGCSNGVSADEFIAAVGRLSFDNMGRDSMIAY